MPQEFQQLQWDTAVEEQCRRLVRLAVAEDLGRGHDWTTVSLVPEAARGKAAVVTRGAGVVAGLKVAQVVLDEMSCDARFETKVADGDAVDRKTTLAVLVGSARDLLTSERPMLNFIGRLSGIATLTAQYVAAVRGTKARIYDTRKTTPGWRLLEKYAVRCGGGHNHRLGLHDAILIKDNHLALGGSGAGKFKFSPAGAVTRARQFVLNGHAAGVPPQMIIEVEVDTLEQLETVLPAQPDVVLLDNMPPDQLREAVRIRNQLAPGVELEASGGVNLDTVAAIAAAGVDRISAGAITHSAVWLDVGLDWL